jgi:hypothetical protein
MSDIIYVLTNEAMPGLVKIGITSGDSVADRMRQLSAHSGVPFAFECSYAVRTNTVHSASEMESWLHDMFVRERVNPRREFFRLSPERVVLALKPFKFEVLSHEEMPEIGDAAEIKAINTARARRPKLSLRDLGIGVGSTLTFSRDETLLAKVIHRDKIEFEGEQTSLSAAALKILHRMGYEWNTVNGAQFWMYDGKLLTDIRDDQMQIEETTPTEPTERPRFEPMDSYYQQFGGKILTDSTPDIRAERDLR